MYCFIINDSNYHKNLPCHLPFVARWSDFYCFRSAYVTILLGRVYSGGEVVRIISPKMELIDTVTTTNSTFADEHKSIINNSMSLAWWLKPTSADSSLIKLKLHQSTNMPPMFLWLLVASVVCLKQYEQHYLDRLKRLIDAKLLRSLTVILPLRCLRL